MTTKRKWGARSKAVYDSLDTRLQMMCDFILQEIADVSLIFGFRDEETQNSLFLAKRSQLQFPKSKHNSWPSMAVDLQPHPYPKKDLELWAALGQIAGAAKAFAIANGFKIRWGGDWDRDGDLTDNKFDDLFHLELID